MKGLFKSILYTALGTLSIFSVVTFQSCEQDKCESVTCANGGKCDDGTCTCPTGYEGTLCEHVTRDKFLRVWNVFEDGTVTNPQQYPVSIEPGTAINIVKIKNAYNNFFESIDATVWGDSIRIFPQTKEDKTIEGIGWIGDDKYYGEHGLLTLKYKVTMSNGLIDEFGTSPNTKLSLWNK